MRTADGAVEAGGIIVLLFLCLCGGSPNFGSWSLVQRLSRVSVVTGDGLLEPGAGLVVVGLGEVRWE